MNRVIAGQLARILFDYLEPRFGKVEIEAPEGVYLLMSVRLRNRTKRWLKVHEDNLAFADLLPKYLDEYDIVSQLQERDVMITRPLHDNT